MNFFAPLFKRTGLFLWAGARAMLLRLRIFASGEFFKFSWIKVFLWRLARGKSGGENAQAEPAPHAFGKAGLAVRIFASGEFFKFSWIKVFFWRLAGGKSRGENAQAELAPHALRKLAGALHVFGKISLAGIFISLFLGSANLAFSGEKAMSVALAVKFELSDPAVSKISASDKALSPAPSKGPQANQSAVSKISASDKALSPAPSKGPQANQSAVSKISASDKALSPAPSKGPQANQSAVSKISASDKALSPAPSKGPQANQSAVSKISASDKALSPAPSKGPQAIQPAVSESSASDKALSPAPSKGPQAIQPAVSESSASDKALSPVSSKESQANQPAVSESSASDKALPSAPSKEPQANQPAVSAKQEGKSPSIKTLDELLIFIQKDQIAQKLDLRRREAEFLKARDRQKALFNKAFAELKKEERAVSSLQETLAQQERQLSQLEEKLALTMGALGELFGVVKQTAAESKALFENSVVSAQYKNREDFAQKISAKKHLPSASDLEALWFLIQREMTESGKVVRFKEEVVKAGGSLRAQNVLRVGSFNLVSEGKYLVYDPKTRQVAELARQPSRRFLSLVKKFERSTKDISAFALDPSRGSLLSLLIQTPSLFERISQGGIIGYIILFLLGLGLFLSAQKHFRLAEQKKLLNLQIQSEEALKNNPLGEIIKVFLKFKDQNYEILELKMEEAILRQTSHLRKGLGTIKLLSGIAPLLGLLGTVTGMIVTFQSITLFGTGDPKLMAGGISQALVTTALGLTVAIPLVFIYNFLSSQANDLISVFEEQSLGLLSRKYKGSAKGKV